MNKMPDDVREATRLLQDMLHDLPDDMTVECKDMFMEMREEIEYCKEHNEDVDWSYYRAYINDICVRDGMPILCEEG